MKAYILEKYGKNSLPKLAEIPEPKYGDDDVLVEVFAVSINPLDSKIKNGSLKPLLAYKTPFVMGYDVAGKIVKIGKNVKNFQVWDEIFARVPNHQMGTFAEFVAISETAIAKKPQNLTFEESASIPLVGLTAWQTFEKANLGAWQKIFIQAGSGGVGTFAIQLAKKLGAFVATTASEKNFEMLKNLGADQIIDYKKENFEEILSDFDVVLNNQDQKTLEKSMKILKKWWKIISISEPPTKEFAKNFGLSWILQMVMSLISYKTLKLAKKYSVEYQFLFMEANGEQLEKIAKILENGEIKPIIDKIFDFSELNEAIKYSESGRAKGKIVVKVK